MRSHGLVNPFGGLIPPCTRTEGNPRDWQPPIYHMPKSRLSHLCDPDAPDLCTQGDRVQDGEQCAQHDQQSPKVLIQVILDHRMARTGPLQSALVPVKIRGSA